MIHTEGLDEHVQLLGSLPQQEVLGVLDRADLFILASRTGPGGDEEGTPTVLAEAASVGAITVSTRHSGIPEMVEDGRTGFLANPDDATSLADAITAAIAAQPAWPEISRAARAKAVSEFDSLKLAQRLPRCLLRRYR